MATSGRVFFVCGGDFIVFLGLLSDLFYLWGLLCAEFCYMLWVTGNTHSRKNIGETRMKNIAEMKAEEYGTTAEEIMVAGAMKLYLLSLDEKAALRKVRDVYEPKVIQLDSGEAVPVQSIIDGAKYAAFIDEAVMFVAQEMRKRGDELAGRVIEELKTVDGKHMVESASVGFMSFIEDAYGSLRWEKK